MIHVPHTKFIKIRLPSDDCSSILKLLNNVCIVRTLEALQNCGRACCRKVNGTDVVLDSNEFSS